MVGADYKPVSESTVQPVEILNIGWEVILDGGVRMSVAIWWTSWF